MPGVPIQDTTEPSTITRLVADLDGGFAHETVTFGLDGHLYEMDLYSKNAKKLRAELSSLTELRERQTPTAGELRERRQPSLPSSSSTAAA